MNLLINDKFKICESVARTPFIYYFIINQITFVL